MRQGSEVRVQGSAKASGRRKPAVRRGHSLIELLVVIAVMTIILSSTTVVLHGMYRADRAARRDLEASTGVARLAQRFRTDAHAAEAVEMNEAVLTFKLADSRSIAYEFAEQRVERVVRRDGKLEHRDAFRLASGNSIEWKSSEQDSVKFVGLQIGEPKGETARIEARVGADRRFESTK